MKPDSLCGRWLSRAGLFGFVACLGVVREREETCITVCIFRGLYFRDRRGDFVFRD